MALSYGRTLLSLTEAIGSTPPNANSGSREVIRRLHSRPPRQTCGLTTPQHLGLARWDFVSSLRKVGIFRCVLSEVGRFRCQISEVSSFVMSRMVEFSLIVLEVRWAASLCLK